MVGPSGVAPFGGVEAVAAVDDVVSAGEGGRVAGVELAAVFVPFSDDDDGVGALEGLVSVGGVGQLWVGVAGVVECLGICHGDVGAEAVEAGGDVEGGGVADVVAVGFEGGAEDGDVLAVDGAVEGVEGELDGAVAAAEVDFVDFVEEGDGFGAAEFFGAGGEGADVFGEAAAAEADAGAEEAASDAGVVADGVGELGDVGAGDLGDFGHGVDEGDLGGQEGVGGDLDEFGGGQVGDDVGGVLGDGRVVDGAEELGGLLAGRAAGDADDEAVGVDGVLDGPAFAEELGVPYQGGAGGFDAGGEGGGGADGDGGFAGDDVSGREVGEEGVDGGVDVGEVGGVAVLALRGADADEVDGGAGGGGDVGGEREAPGGDAVGEDLLQAGFEERGLALGQGVDLVLVDVDADDFVADRGHRGRVDRAQVATADHRQSHRVGLPLVVAPGCCPDRAFLSGSG